jgi:predicted transglutaminase-like protease
MVDYHPRAKPKNRKIDGKIYLFDRRFSIHTEMKTAEDLINKLKKNGWIVRTKRGIDVWGYKCIDVFRRSPAWDEMYRGS